jgi:hypothetical protein
VATEWRRSLVVVVLEEVEAGPAAVGILETASDSEEKRSGENNCHNCIYWLTMRLKSFLMVLAEF